MAAGESKVVVIGSGVGGAACAALLALEGFEVTLLERNDFPGGKAASFERDGFVYDTGVHAVGSGDKGPLGDISRKVDAGLEWALVGGNRICLGNKVANYPLDFASDESIRKIIEGIGVLPENRDDCYVCFKELSTMKPASEMEVLDKMPLKDYVSQFTDDFQFHQMINATCGMLIVVTYFTGSTGEFIYCFAGMAQNASLSYPKGGMGSIAKTYLAALERLGGSIEYSRPVEKILLENGRVVGVEAKGRIEADIVVSNMGLQPTAKMIADHLPVDYFEKVMKLRSSYGAVSVKYALDTEVVPYPMTLWIPDINDREALEKYVGIMYPVPSIPDPGLAPEGCQLVLAGAVLSADPKQKELNQQILDRIEATMQMLHPGIEDHVVWKLRTDVEYTSSISGRHLGEVIGISQDYRQVGNDRPDPRMPLGGLYVVGADAGGRGIGTEMAAESALAVSQMVMEDVMGQAKDLEV
ncbi:MAG TPA: NAD(P)/FAD-dependent oxidoreductase [Candidatus Anoxymicrobiaceae bacterium]